MTYAITHAGQAHPDEFIALAIIVAKDGVDLIVRRDPTEAELDDPNIWVVDVGGRHEPQLRNFDHHGVLGTENFCAFDLVLAHYGLADIAVQASPWLAFKSTVDRIGPYATAKAYGMTPETFFATGSPIESQILHMFSQASCVEPCGPELSGYLFQTLKLVGEGLLSYWADFQRQSVLAEAAPILLLKGLRFCDFRYCGPLMPAVTAARMSEIKAAGSVSVDDRGPDCEHRVVLYRHADHPAVDFRRLDPSRMHFVHDNGFLAKTATHDNSPARIIELLLAAVH